MAFCHQCGAALEQGDRFCSNCGTAVRGIEGDTQPPPPAAAQARGEAPASQRYQGVGIRFVAQLIDGIVLAILYFVLGYIIGGATGNLTEDGFKMTGAPAILLIGLNFILWLVYFIVCEAFWNGQSLGKKLTGIRVVDLGGGPISFNQAVVRNVLRIVDGLCVYLVGAILVWNSPRRQRLGDRVAGTVVVKKARS